MVVLAIGSLIFGLAAAAASWTYLRSRRRWARVDPEGRQVANVIVRERYRPDIVYVRCGLPLRLTFFRDEEAPCSSRVIIPDFGISRTLPAHRATHLDLMPDREGDFLFTCELGMYQGTLLVRN